MESFDVSRQLKAFRVGTDDVAVLRGLRPLIERHLESILVESRTHFAAWPEIEAALARPAMHRARYEHWMRAATGDFGSEFGQSALRFAASFVEQKIPAHAVVLCHHAVLDVATAKFDQQRPAARFGVGRAAVEAHERMLKTLAKAVWFDIEVLIEAYAIAAAAERRRLLDGIASDLETAVGAAVQGIGKASEGLRTTAKTMSASSEQAQSRSAAVAAASEEASANVQTVASAAEELTSSISEIGRQVHEAARVAESAVRDASRTASEIRELSSAAQKIGEVVELINTIAGQTNLLALNATIEAARAGEAGRGFAVVAAEVKQLADQTGRATSTIAAQITGIQDSTQRAVNSVTEISGVISQLNDISAAVAAAVEQQGAATKEIAQNVSQAYAGTAEVSGNITGVSEAAARTADASREVLSSSDVLGRQAEALKGEVARFLGSIRAA
jgi:methyl-accepting chemotaxis protein